MKIFWVLTYVDVNGNVHRDNFDEEVDAREAFYIATHPLFLDQVYRYENRL